MEDDSILFSQFFSNNFHCKPLIPRLIGMKSVKCFLIFTLGLVFGCADPEPPVLPESDNKHVALLKEVLNGPLATPVGRLKSESFYYGPNTLQYRTDFYYNEAGQELLKVRIQNGDTTGIYLNEYLEGGKLDQTGVYFPGSEGFIFAHFFKRFYEVGGKTIHIMLEKDDNSYQYEQYNFDGFGRKISYRRGSENAYDLHEYLYENDQSTKIIEEQYRQTGMTEPFYRYRYDYDNNNLLIAKSLQIVVPEYRPAYGYSYNEQGNLKEEITNDLYFGTVATERKTFEYY